MPFRWQLLKSFLWYNLISSGLYFKTSLIKRSLICSGRSRCGSYVSLGYPPTQELGQGIHTRPTLPLKEGVEVMVVVQQKKAFHVAYAHPPPQDCPSVCFRGVCWSSGMWWQNEDELVQEALEPLHRDQQPLGRKGPRLWPQAVFKGAHISN